MMAITTSARSLFAKTSKQQGHFVLSIIVIKQNIMKMILLRVLSLLIAYLSIIGAELGKFQVDMGGQMASKHDDYLCAWKKLDEFQVYITKLEPHVDESIVHHLATFGYTEEQMEKMPLTESRNCFGLQVRGYRIFNWSHGSGSFTMPEATGMIAGRNSTNIHYIVIQAHYSKPFTSKCLYHFPTLSDLPFLFFFLEPDFSGMNVYYDTVRPNRIATITVFVPSTFTIPPQVERYQVVWSCNLKLEQPIHIFATRVHGHWLSRENSVFYRLPNETEYSTLVARSPQRPQSYIPTDRIYTLLPEHELVGRCVFNSMSENKSTLPGHDGEVEMCNLYAMYYGDDHSNTPVRPRCLPKRTERPIGLPLPLESEVVLPFDNQQHFQMFVFFVA